MDVDLIDTHSPGSVVNFQRAWGSVVLAKILGSSQRGVDYRSITYERSGAVVTHDCAPIAWILCVNIPTTHSSSLNRQPVGEKAPQEEDAVEVGPFSAHITPSR